MIFAIVTIVCCIGFMELGYRAGLRKGRFETQFELEKRVERANGLFSAADAELNALKVQHSQLLMELENAKRDVALLSRRN